MNLNLKHIFRKRLLVIFLHLAAWAVFIFYPFIFFRLKVIGYEFYYKQIINAVFLAAVFYFSSYYLFPRLIKKIKLVKHILMLAGLLIFIPLQQFILEFYFFNRTERDHVQIISPISKEKIAEFHSVSPRKEIRVIVRRDSFVHRDSIVGNRFFNAPVPVHTIFFHETLQTSVSSVLFVLLMSGFVSVAGEFFKTDKKRKELENQRLNAELAYLKSQVNPHFFFNTLNAIYLLAHKKSDQTEHVVLKLSEIMRYMIYESNASQVSLSREIKYLSDYIDLQRIRLSKKIDVEFIVEGEPGNLLISPMLLIPFVENAFKHGISYVEPANILIKLSIQGNMIQFETSNKIFNKQEKQEENHSGLGLSNVKKRLLLLYPQLHSLNIDQENREYKVKLQINLKHD